MSLFRRISPTLMAASCVLAGLAPAATWLGTAPASATASFSMTRVAGANRYDTAGAAALAAFPSASTVVLASGQSFPDALTASYLAGVFNAPILLSTAVAPVPAGTLRAIAALKTQNVYVLGGTNAIGDDVAAQLRATPSSASGGGNLQVVRVAGTDRFGTNQAGAQAGAQSGPPSATQGQVANAATALIASGANFPDAVSAGPLAWARHFPMVLTDPSVLSPQAAQTLRDLNIQQVLVVGGPAAVSVNVEQQINSMGITTLARLAGSDRSDTSRRVAEYAVSTLGFTAASLTLATGDAASAGVDALAGGSFAGSQGPSPLLITNSTADVGQAAAFAAAHTSTLTGGVALGGSASLPDASVATVTASARSGLAGEPFTDGAARAVVPAGASRSYSVAVGSAPVDIQIAACQDVRGSPPSTFYGSDPGGTDNVAVYPTAVGATIVSLQGVNVSPAATVDNVAPANGYVSFSMSDATGECALAVVFGRADGNDSLSLTGDGHPVETFGVGGATAYRPPAAAFGSFGSTGSGSPAVSFADPIDGFFVSGGQSYSIKSGDVLQLFNAASQTCNQDSAGDFVARLTDGDAVSGAYATDAPSTFCLDDQAPAQPQAVAASTGGCTYQQPCPCGASGSSGSGSGSGTASCPCGASGTSCPCGGASGTSCPCGGSTGGTCPQPAYGTTASPVGGGSPVFVYWSEAPAPSVVSYTVYRSPASGACPASAPDVSPQVAPTAPWMLLTTIDRHAAGTAPVHGVVVQGGYRYVAEDDTTASGTSYCYLVASVDTNGQVGTGVVASS